MSEDKPKPKINKFHLIIIIVIGIVIGGFGYYATSQQFDLPQAKDVFNKFDHFRFEPEYVFIEAGKKETADDLGQYPKNELKFTYYRMVKGNLEKAMSETYKNQNGTMINVITVSNSTDPIVYLSIQDSEFVTVDPFSFTTWNAVLEFEKKDVNGDGTLENFFKLDISDAVKYYQLEEKPRENPIVKLFIPVSLKFINY